MKPKSKREQVRVPPKKAVVFRQEQTHSLKSNLRPFLHSSHSTETTIFRMQQKLQESHNEVKEEVKKATERLERFENQSLAYEGREQWLLEHGINLPMKTMEEFNKYCSLLEQTSECRKMLETSVHFAINGKKSLTKNIATVLRKYFTGELATQFTAIKFVKEKTVIGKTSFYKHILENFLSKSADGTILRGLTVVDFNKALGEVLANAKYWNRRELMQQTNN